MHLRRVRAAVPLAVVLASAAVLNLAAGQQTPAKQSIAEKIAADRGKLDLNTATPDEFKALRLGDNYIRRIIAGRPYTAKNQLVSRGVLPASAYEPIKDKIIAHRTKKPAL